MSADFTQWIDLLRQPDIPQDISKDRVYRAACIGAVMLLYEAADTAALAETVRHAATPESRTRALLALERLTGAEGVIHENAVHQLHELTVLEGVPEAAAFLKKTDFQDRDPGWNSARMLCFEQKHRLLKSDPEPEHLTELFLISGEPLRLRLLGIGQKVLPNWAALMHFLDDPSETNRERIIERFSSFAPGERKLLRYCADSDNSRVNSLPADLFLRNEDETLQELCRQHCLRPSQPSQEALFFFLSGQWDLYYAADSDYRCIRIAYEQNDPGLQRRLIAVSRDSGNNAWLRDVNSSQDHTPRSGSLSDQHLFSASLIEQKQWKRLWDILPNLPLLCMPAVIEALKAEGFQPGRPEEQAFFQELSEKIKTAEGKSPIPVRTRYAENLGTAYGICGSENWFAVVFSDRRILVWDKRSSSDKPVCISSNRLNFRKAVISPDNKYLCADCGRDGITVFTLPGGQAVKTIPISESSLPGLFIQKDGRRLITLGQNGKGIVYAFPGGTELYRYDIGMKDCSHTAYDPDMNTILSFSPEGTCMIYDISGRRLVSGVQIGKQVLTSEEFFSHSRIALIEKDELFSVLNLLSGRAVIEKIPQNTLSARRITAVFEGDLYALGTINGQIYLFDPCTGHYPALLSLGSKAAVTGLWYDKNGAVLYGCSASGSVLSWDMELFREMTAATPLLKLPGINRINEFEKKYPESGVKAAAEWLKTVIAWRKRYDIEVDFE